MRVKILRNVSKRDRRNFGERTDLLEGKVIDVSDKEAADMLATGLCEQCEPTKAVPATASKTTGSRSSANTT